MRLESAKLLREYYLKIYMDRKNKLVRLAGLRKIFLLFKESDFRVWPKIIWNFRPDARRRGGHFSVFLESKGIIKNFAAEKKINFLNHFFYYEAEDLAALTADLVSIWGRDFQYFREKFINTGLYFFEGPYETDSVQVKNGDYVVDAGANLGLFSILSSEKVGPVGIVYAFEPIQKAGELLEKNIEVNKCQNIKVLPLALGQQNGQVSFQVGKELGSSSAVFSKEVVNGSESETVEMRTLDFLVESGEITRVDFIKADIEGGERDLLAGAKETIKKFHPRLSICIYHRPNDKQVLTDLLLSIEPKYKISYSSTKMFAYYNNTLK